MVYFNLLVSCDCENVANLAYSGTTYEYYYLLKFFLLDGILRLDALVVEPQQRMKSTLQETMSRRYQIHEVIVIF
jgi:hypothetical protein